MFWGSSDRQGRKERRLLLEHVERTVMLVYRALRDSSWFASFILYIITVLRWITYNQYPRRWTKLTS